MKFIILLSAILLSFSLSFSAHARDTRTMFSYEDALQTPAAKSKLGNDIKFFFGKQASPAAAKEFGEFSTNKKTNAFGKSDHEACQWVFLSAMISLRDRARELGADAVINIKSNYKSDLKDSNTQFECGAGSLMAGVALTGKFIKTK
jgi:hypothetical protein